MSKNRVSGFKMSEVIWLWMGEVLFLFHPLISCEVEDWIVGLGISWSPSLEILNLLMQEKGITDLGI